MPSGIPDTMMDLAVPVDSLVPYQGNARRGDVGMIAESLQTHGQYRPVVVRKETNEVLAGNHTLAAAQHLGWTELAATFVSCDDDQARRIVLVDNRTNDAAGYDNAELLHLLRSLDGDLAGTGFTDADLDALEADLLETCGPPVSNTDPDDPPPTARGTGVESG